MRSARPGISLGQLSRSRTKPRHLPAKFADTDVASKQTRPARLRNWMRVGIAKPSPAGATQISVSPPFRMELSVRSIRCPATVVYSSLQTATGLEHERPRREAIEAGFAFSQNGGCFSQIPAFRALTGEPRVTIETRFRNSSLAEPPCGTKARDELFRPRY